MADKDDENPENADKIPKKEQPEDEKANKDDTNEKLKIENQEIDKKSVKEQDTSKEQDTTKEQDTKKVNDTTEVKEQITAKEEDTAKELDTTIQQDNSENDAQTIDGGNEEQQDVKPNDKVKEHEKTREDRKQKEPSKVVDLKLVQSHYKTHTRTTLPHILTEYGMEDKEHTVKKREKKEKKRKKKSDDNDDNDDDDRQRRKAREEKFRQTFGDNRDTDSYYAEYIDFLEKKVAEQRLKAEQQREEEKRLAALKVEEESDEEKEKKEKVEPVEQKQRHRLQKRLQRIELKHDDTFMKDLPRTDISKIILLQDKMKRDGKLKTQGDVDKFWRDIKKPEVFYSHFRAKPIDPITPFPERQLSETNTNENSGDHKEPNMAPRSLSHISEASKGDKEPWAITQKFQSSHGPKTPTGQRKNSAQIAKEAALDLERRCPKLEMPPLTCFTLQLGEKPPDPEEIQRKIELKLREKNRKKTQRKINRMYQMAMTNTAAANRIMAQHKDLTTMFEGAALRDVLSVFDEPFMTGIPRERMSPSMALEQYPGVREMLDAHPPSQPSTRQSSAASSRQSSAASRKLTPISDTASKASSKSRRQKAQLAIEFPEPLPLSFTELEREKTIEAKCLSTYWTNYMHAGKSAYAPTQPV